MYDCLRAWCNPASIAYGPCRGRRRKELDVHEYYFDLFLQKEKAQAAAKGEPAKAPSPFTVDLHNPPVDVSAPLDERDIELVQQTFAEVAKLGVETVGIILFTNIFEIAPGAKPLFKFEGDDVSKSPKMKKHGANVVTTVATAVSLLRDLGTLVPVLQGLGLRHVGYAVIPAHYDIVGQALIKSLQMGLGENMTPAVTNAYLKVYTVVKDTMVAAGNYPK
jgi:hemoglobin-like flavoprotein